jgi:hypothetical protein
VIDHLTNSLNSNQAHLQFTQTNAQLKIAKELALPTRTKIVFKKIPNASKKIKTLQHKA